MARFPGALSLHDESNSSGLERGPFLFHALRDRNRFRLHPPYELLIRRRLNDRIELRSVVGDEADPLDDDVIDEPAVATHVHAVVDGNFRFLFGDDLGAHGRLLTLDRLAGVADLLAGVQLELGHVRALHEVGEQLDEFFLLRGRAPVPVPRQSTLRHLFEIEGLVRDPAEGGPPFPGPDFRSEVWIPESLEGPIDGLPQLIGWRPGGGATTGQQHEGEGARQHRAGTAERLHRRASGRLSSITFCRRCRYPFRTAL